MGMHVLFTVYVVGRPPNQWVLGSFSFFQGGSLGVLPIFCSCLVPKMRRLLQEDDLNFRTLHGHSANGLYLLRSGEREPVTLLSTSEEVLLDVQWTLGATWVVCSPAPRPRVRAACCWSMLVAHIDQKHSTHKVS